MINLVLVKKDMLQYVEDVRTVRGMEQGISDHHVLCKVMLLGTWIRRREVVNGVLRIRSEEFREQQYIEEYFRCLESNYY